MRFVFEVFGVVDIGGVKLDSHRPERNFRVCKGTRGNAASASAGGKRECNIDWRKVDAGGNVCSTSDGLAVARNAIR